MAETFWSIIPPILAIIMVLATRRVLISLGVGIVASAFFIAEFRVEEAIKAVFIAFQDVFIDEGWFNMGNLYIIFFIFMLGIITNFVSQMGGTQAFGNWMIKRVRTRIGAQLMTFFLGVALFIDDYFNSLTVGQVARPITDVHRISRAKLAYIVDSTAAPICVIAPISSWGAYILGLIGTVFVTHQVVDYTALGAFLLMIPMNFYVWAALGVVIVIILCQTDFGAMKKYEQHAIKTGEVIPPYSEQKVVVTVDEKSNSGKLSDLVVPIIVLFIATFFFIFWTGFQAVEEQPRSLIRILGEADVSKSLFYSGLIALLATFILLLRHIRIGELNSKHFISGLMNGIKSMMSAVLILIFAWTISDLIEQLGTGTYLAKIVQSANISLTFLPLIVFIMAGVIAFSTGTSWGSFALLLPIAGQIAAVTNIDFLLPMLAAVLAGAVFGDHCSPISDTTILSATGSDCHHIDHVITQLPYAFVAAIIAGLGYLVFGFTSNIFIGLFFVFVGLIIFYFILKNKNV